MKDRLITIAMSVSATLGLIQVGPDQLKELDVDRLIVRQELIVSFRVRAQRLPLR